MFNRSFELDKLCAAESFDDGEICICLLEVLTLRKFKKRENGSSWKKNDTSKFPVGVLIVIMLLNSVRVPQE